MPTGYTPEQIAQMRQHALALQTPPEGGIKHWTQGLAELVRAIQGNREADFARQQELAGRQSAADAITSLYQPYLSGGASPAARTSDASTGTTAPASNDDNTGGGSSAPASGTITADSSLPRGLRNNNPLNIEDGQFARSQPGYAGSDGRFAKFEAPEHGLAAANTLIDSYQRNHGLNTISGIVSRWAPSSDGNDTRAYAANVARQMGIGPNDPIPPEMRPRLIAAMAQHENGRPLPTSTGARTGLMAPTPSEAASTAPMSYAREDATPAGLPPEITQGASLPARAAVPSVSPLVNAIAGRPMPPITAASTPPGQLPSPGGPVSPADFASAAAAMEASKGPPVPLQSTPINQPSAGIPPADFARAAAEMEARKAAVPAAPLPSPGAAVSPADFSAAANDIEATRSGGIPPDQFARAAAAMEAAKPTTSVPLGTAVPGATPDLPPPAAPVAAAPIAGRVPLPQRRPGAADLGSFRMVPAPGGGLMPMAVPGPTAAAPSAVPASTLANFQGVPAPGAGIMPMAVPPRAPGVPSLAGPPSFAPAATPVSAPGTPAAGGGAPAGGAPIRVAQAGPSTGGLPAGAGGPPGLPQPLTSPVGQISPQQLTQMLANPWVPDSAKAAMLQMIQQRAQPQSMPVEGGTMMFDAAGRKVFIPEPRFGTVKIGSAEIPTVSHFDPATRQWNTTTLAPGGGVQTSVAPPAGSAPAPAAGGGVALPPTGGAATLPHPASPQVAAQPDLSTIGGIQAAEAAQAGAKKKAETEGETSAKYYDSLRKGLTGSATIAAQQKQNIDMLRQVAASPDFTPGAGSEAALGLQRLAAAFGINPEGAAPREIFNQVATRILADQISGLKSMASETGEQGGRIFKSMLDLEEKANITPEDTAAGINSKLDLIDKAGDLMMKWGDMANDYEVQHGKLDAGFEKQLRKEIAGARIPNVVPKAAPEPSSGPSQSDIEAEMRRRKLLPPAGPPVAPVSQ
jgi:hypothetical protein